MPLQGSTPFAHIDDHCAQNAARAHPKMIVKSAIFGCDNRMQEMGADSVRCDCATKLLASPSKNFAVSIQHRHGTARARVQKVGYGGQLAIVVEGEAKQDQRKQKRAAPRHGKNHPHNPTEETPKQRTSAAWLFLLLGAAPRGPSCSATTA